jgi:hypothetical protein
MSGGRSKADFTNFKLRREGGKLGDEGQKGVWNIVG